MYLQLHDVPMIFRYMELEVTVCMPSVKDGAIENT